jgi:hypothetical protein
MSLMFTLQEKYNGGNHVIGLYVTFTNPYNAHYLLGQAFWCGCEYIAFTTNNVFTNFHNVCPIVNGMHTLPTSCRRTMSEGQKRGQGGAAGQMEKGYPWRRRR